MHKVALDHKAMGRRKVDAADEKIEDPIMGKSNQMMNFSFKFLIIKNSHQFFLRVFHL